jgi:hypothetical protein
MKDVYPIPEFLRQPVEAPRARPILFSAPMVRALLAGTKTQTRRALKVQPLDVIPFEGDKAGVQWVGRMQQDPPRGVVFGCKFGKPSDRLYVRENAWQRPERTQKMMREGADTWPPFIYDADYPAGIPWEERDNLKTWGWKRRPSIHLPRIGSRILLEIVAVRVERLNDISNEDSIAEGVNVHPDHHGKPRGSIYSPMSAYRDLWESINGPGAWAANPWVWVVEFRRVKPC